jgi:pantoate--beta-alanine ligase
MDRARQDCNCVVVTIFVNPTQFDLPNDYAAYAVDLARDLEFCEARNADVVFAPALEEMYPSPQKIFVEVSGLSDHLCGKFRPGHFRGVATIVAKLFNIVTPDRAYLGEKDAQQLAVVQRLTTDLNIPVEIVPVPTVREPDGLALSSRNQRLSAEERSIAPVLFKALRLAQSKIEEGESVARARKAAMDVLQGIRVEYLEVVDAETMEPVERVSGPVRIAAAIWLGTTRLIDNVYCLPAKA